jgi:PAS domain S-box-containing protein
MEVPITILVLLAAILFMGGLFTERLRSYQAFIKKGFVRQPEPLSQSDGIFGKFATYFGNTINGYALQEIICNEDGQVSTVRFIEVNRRFMDIFGLKTDIADKNLSEVLPAFETEWLRDYKNLLQTGKTSSRQIYLENRDTFLEMVIFPVAGKIVGASFHNITHWVKAEQQLKSIIARFNGIFFSIRRNGIFTLSEGLALDKLGLAPGQAVNMNAFELYKDYPSILEALQKCLEGHYVEQVFLINNTWLETRLSPALDNTGAVIGVNGFAVDITPQTLANELLIQSEAKYRSIVENMQSGFTLNELLFDTQGVPCDVKILHANSRFRELYKLSSLNDTETYSNLFPGFEYEYAEKAFQVIETGKSYTRVGHTLNNRFIESTLFKAHGNQFIRLDTDLTHRMHTQNELEASRQKFMGIYNMLSDMAGIIRLSDLHILECNPAFSKITGYSPAEYTGKTLEDLEILADPSSFASVIEALMESDLIKGHECLVKNREGMHLTFLLTVQKIIFEEESCLLFLAHDITERKKTEEAMTRRLVVLTQPLDVSASLVFDDLFNLDEIQELQDAFASATGVASVISTPEGIPITKPSHFCHFCTTVRQTDTGSKNCRFSSGIIGSARDTAPDIRPCLSGGLWDAGAQIKVGNKHIATWIIGQIRKDNFEISRIGHFAADLGIVPNALVEAYQQVPMMSEDQFQIIARSLQTLARHLSQLAYQNIQQARFITELKKTQDDLMISEQRFADIYQMSPVIIGISRLSDGKIIHGNLALSKIMGQAPENAEKKTTHETGIWKTEQERDEMLEELQHSGEIVNRETTLTLQNGIDLICLFSARKITFHEEECLLFLVYDISDRKRVEEQIFQMNANLEKTIAERTEQLQQAVRDQEAFAYSVSHDLRSPLRHIDGFLKLLSPKIDMQDDNIRNYLEKINMATTRMANMIDDLLIFSRLGRKDLEIREVDLNILVTEIIEQFKVAFANRKIEWKINLLPVIHCDRNLFKQLFENLISNAIKYTSKKPSAIIEIGARDMPNQTSEIFVKDNGVGFDNAYVDKLFKVFQRLHPGDEYAGTGIGLANVKQIASRHGAKVRAEGTPNEGATFYLTINKP